MKVYPIILCLSAVLTSGCDLFPSRLETANHIAADAGFHADRYLTGPFEILTYSKGHPVKNGLLSVYIEGDGQAWRRKYQLASDPTPRDPLALKLAARDTNPSVLYLGRPCQYLGREKVRDCPKKYWSSHRYAPEVVSALNNVIDQYLSNAPDQRLILTGYSGGGTLAALIAAERKDVIMLVTIAANLDNRAWTSYHEVSPLSGSLNAADRASTLRDLPQLHFIGSDDGIVPASTLDNYLKEFPADEEGPLRLVKGFDHSCCWVDAWPGLLCEEPDLPKGLCEIPN